MLFMFLFFRRSTKYFLRRLLPKKKKTRWRFFSLDIAFKRSARSAADPLSFFVNSLSVNSGNQSRRELLKITWYLFRVRSYMKIINIIADQSRNFFLLYDFYFVILTILKEVWNVQKKIFGNKRGRTFAKKNKIWRENLFCFYFLCKSLFGISPNK
jgi:hypothetical protein